MARSREQYSVAHRVHTAEVMHLAIAKSGKSVKGQTEGDAEQHVDVESRLPCLQQGQSQAKQAATDSDGLACRNDTD